MIPFLKRVLATLLFGLTLFATLMEAQESSDSANNRPTPPYLAPFPKNLHWIVTFSYLQKTASGAPAPAPATYPAKVETIKVGDARRVTVTFVNRPSQQFDIFGATCFVQTSDGLQCFTVGENYQPYPFFDRGFSFTQCVKLDLFKGRTIYQGTPVFHYQNDSSEAWIAVSTALPMGADFINNVKTVYQYLPEPSPGDVTITPAEQKILDNRRLGGEIFKNMR